MAKPMNDLGETGRLPERKQLRLPQYDYSTPGAYFVTICTEGRKCILSDITVGADALGGPILQLSEHGKVVEKFIHSMERQRGIHVDNYVIMPNHIHLLLRIDRDNVGTDNGPPRASAPTISDAVGALKRLINRTLGENIFQRSYHEHVIRNEKDYCEIWSYIENNPARWAEDRYHATN